MSVASHSSHHSLFYFNFKTQFCIVAQKKFFTALLIPVQQLLDTYNNTIMLNSGSWQHYWFHKSSLWSTSLHSFRNQIEFKIISRLFFKMHHLPIEFNFAKYCAHLFKVTIFPNVFVSIAGFGLFSSSSSI